MIDPLKIYEKRQIVYNNLFKKQTKTINKISNIRLIVALAGVLSIVFLYIRNKYFLIYPISIAYIVLFTYLVIKHSKLKYNNKYFDLLGHINENGLQRLKGNWNQFKDTGLEFKDDNHSYSSDLDIFGQGSLFQYINTTTTYMGREILSKYLTQPCKNREGINKRQKAIEELSNKLSWRQRFMVEGLMINEELNNSEPLYGFFETKDETYTKPWVIIMARLLPIITIGCFLLYLFEFIPYYIPSLVLLVQIFLYRFKFNKRSKELNLVYKYENDIKVYSKMLYRLDRGNFKSEYLLELKNKLIDDNKLTAYQQIKELETIVENISNRKNFYFLIINIMTLWDYQSMIALEDWKKKSGSLVRTWIETIGEFEALSSLANINYDNPKWIIPKITDKEDYIMAKDIGHPLIIENPVCNDFKIDGQTKALLITGSNMSGKSTYLRTIGINLVLAYTGAAVFAKDLHCNIFNIWTCMRVSDNLEKNISSFYAELLRIKEIVNKSKTNKVFFLLDEIFKGTNSHDRHEGAKILIKKLLRNKAIGLVSTHDLELGELEKESNNKIKNYHFKEYYKDNEIYFDYKLNLGISTTRNAMYLINMIGIGD